MPFHNRGGIKHFWRMLCIKYSRYGFYPHLTTKISTSDFHTKIFISHFKNPQNYPKILRELSRPTKHKHCISTILNSPKITKIHHNIDSYPKQTLTVTVFSPNSTYVPKNYIQNTLSKSIKLHHLIPQCIHINTGIPRYKNITQNYLSTEVPYFQNYWHQKISSQFLR